MTRFFRPFLVTLARASSSRKRLTTNIAWSTPTPIMVDLAITSDGPVRSVLLFSDVPAESLGGRDVVVSTSSMTSVRRTNTPNASRF